MASVRDAEETLNLLKEFSDEILTEAERKGLTRYEVWKLPKVLESTIRRENFQNEKPYKEIRSRKAADKELLYCLFVRKSDYFIFK